MLGALFQISMVAPAQLIRLKGIQQELIDSTLYSDLWTAHWISVPEAENNDYGVYHFRKMFLLDQVPDRYIVHVSADNRYKLYINNRLVSLGPVRGDLYNWHFETIDLAPYLHEGKNLIAAVVWNYGVLSPCAQVSTGQAELIVQGNTEREAAVNTDATWKCIQNNAYSPCQSGQVIGYYVAGPGEKVDMRFYPWGWRQIDYDDSHWMFASSGMAGAMKGLPDYHGRLLVPSPIPPMEMRVERIPSLRLSENINVPDNFPALPSALKIAPHSSVRILLDNKMLTTGYLSLLLEQGRGTEITISYAESLYENVFMTDSVVNFEKGNRNEIRGKQFLGYEDKILPDGGENRLYTTLWWRTWRYIDLQIKTADAPLVLKDIYSIFTAYPLKRISSFEATTEDSLSRMLDIGWRTARLCANETYMDCPYYEQLQYFGDTRIQAMITMYNTADTCLVKHAIEQGRQSMTAEGITMSRYPSRVSQFISSYALSWIGMIYDYWMYRGEDDFICSLLPDIRRIMAWYEQLLKPDGTLGYVPYWFFVDWAAGFKRGEPPREAYGNSFIQDLTYLLALKEASALERALGMSALAEHYDAIGKRLQSCLCDKYWNENRNLFADTSKHDSFSQHANLLAVLADILTAEDAKDVAEQILTDSSLTKSTIYYRYYLHQALDKAGLGDNLLDVLTDWRKQMALGLTTWAESPEPSRSDCHAWGASLNIEFYRIILGIRSGAPGFKRVIIKPSLGDLKQVSGTIPHPQGGTVRVSYEKINSILKAEITLPQGISGLFLWQGKEYPLEPGIQKFIIK